MSVQVSVPDDFAKVIEQVQKHKGYETKQEAIQYIGQVFVSRFKAVLKYGNKQKAEKGAAKPKAKKKAAKAKKE